MPDTPKDAYAERLREYMIRMWRIHQIESDDYEMINDVADRLDSRAIPVGERLPESCAATVLGYSSQYGWQTGVFLAPDYKVFRPLAWPSMAVDTAVTHWQPMPPPPTS